MVDTTDPGGMDIYAKRWPGSKVSLIPQTSGNLGLTTSRINSATFLSDEEVDDLITYLSYYKFKKVERGEWDG